MHVISENNLLGIVNEKNETLLPCIYDDIEFFGGGRYAHLHKKGKVGIKDFFGTYNTLEPKYESIGYDILTITGNNSAKFNLYTVKVSGQNVYVGENGIEFFNFD